MQLSLRSDAVSCRSHLADKLQELRLADGGVSQEQHVDVSTTGSAIRHDLQADVGFQNEPQPQPVTSTPATSLTLLSTCS
jgi:hypothetical protein